MNIIYKNNNNLPKTQYYLHFQNKLASKSRIWKWYMSAQIMLETNYVEIFKYSYTEIKKLQIKETFLKSKHRVNILQNLMLSQA